MKKLLLFVVLALCTSLTGYIYAQQPPFWNEIQAFKKQDSVQPPPPNSDLFVGSSSFRMWKNLQEAFPYYPVVNRGFGGSTLPDLIRYADDIIIPYQPRQILIYAGDNDLASSDTVTASTVYRRFVQLFDIIRSKLPNTYIAFVSIKPSPSRQRLMPQMAAANSLIKSFLKNKPRTAFIDVYHPMLDAHGQPNKDLFLEDNLHMNEKGYAIWQKAIKPYLLR